MKPIRWRVKKGGRNQGRKWCLYKGNSSTPAHHSRSWAEVMAIAISITHGNRLEDPRLYRYGGDK